MGALFDFRGRASRLTYWRIQLLSIVLAGVVEALGYFAILSVGRIGAVAFAAFAPILLMLLATVLKRLHDRDKGVVWLLFFLLFPVAAALTAHSLVTLGADLPRYAGGGLVLCGLGVNLWAFVEIGFLRGTPTPNRFGAPVI